MFPVQGIPQMCHALVRVKQVAEDQVRQHFPEGSLGKLPAGGIPGKLPFVWREEKVLMPIYAE
jgi:hypothetical protein